MRNLPPENQTKPLNEADLENIIEDIELTAQNNLTVIIDMVLPCRCSLTCNATCFSK